MLKKIITNFNKTLASILILATISLSFSPMFAKRADAFFFVDWVNLVVNTSTSVSSHAGWIKEYGLDTVAYSIINLVIEKISASTINWINSGFKGSPAFISNPEAVFKDIGDKVAGQYILENTNLDFLCSPIRSKIRVSLARGYLRQNDNFQCKLTDISGNVEDFMNDFERGGWDKFFTLSQDSSQNPIGVYIEAEGQIAKRIASKLELKNNELAWGKGFLTKKSCVRWSTPSEIPNDLGNIVGDGFDSNGLPVDVDADIEDEVYLANNSGVSNDFVPTCIEERTDTPGSVIETKLNSVLNIGDGRIGVADELNEIISALLNQLASQIVGGIGKGLRGLSKPDATNNNRTFTSLLSSSTKDSLINEYFETSTGVTDDVLNSPTPNFNACRNNPNLPECLPPPGSQDSLNGGTNPVSDICLTNPTLPECGVGVPL